ncbi:MAG: hypothetical protein RLZZ546_2744 [Bacteroidota bacterium]|jgi:hypothetical protein
METKEIRNKIIEIIKQNQGEISKNISDDTNLSEIGIDGDDANDVMSNYFTTFRIDANNFIFEEYFGYEGFSFIEFLRTIFGRQKLKKITIKLLIENAIKGKWED